MAVLAVDGVKLVVPQIVQHRLHKDLSLPPRLHDPNDHLHLQNNRHIHALHWSLFQPQYSIIIGQHALSTLGPLDLDLCIGEAVRSTSVKRGMPSI